MTVATKDDSPWLLLVFSLPTERASQRVEVWRKLQRYGALPLRNSGYLLPNRPDTQEHVEWLATMIRNYGGEASVIEVQSIDDQPPQRLVQRFVEARSREFEALQRELQKVASLSPPRRAARLSRLRRRFQEITAIDFFGSRLRRRVEEMLATADQAGGAARAAEPEPTSRKQYQGRLWVTRPSPGIDRVTSAWLIRRFIDARPRFTFAVEGQVPRGAVPFDMFQGGFGHRGEDCTFETLQRCFRIRDRKVTVISQMVHDADLGDEKFGRKEAFGIDEVLKGWAKQELSDKEILVRGMELVEGLYHSIP